MKILILGFAKIKYMPYLKEILACTQDEDITLFYFDRDDEKDQVLGRDIRLIRYYKKLSDFDSPIKKARAFYGYRKEVKKLLKANEYDIVVSLHTWPAMLLFSEITKKYYGRFIYDYKDVTFEGRRWFKYRVAKLIEASRYTLISSRAFLKVLPESDKYLISNNINIFGEMPNKNPGKKVREASPVRISFWGLLRHEKTDLAFIKALDGDERFELHFYGRDGDYIRNYIEEYSPRNIFLHGTYEPEEIKDIASSTDLLLNFQDRTFANSLVLANKLYDGAYYFVPQIGDAKTYMGKCIEKNGLGICVDPSQDNLADTLYNYIVNLDYDNFYSSCTSFIERALNENEQTRSTLCHTISTGKKTEN